MPTRKEVNKQIRESLGLPPKSETIPTLPQEGHCAEFPFWSYSKTRSTVTRLDIKYEDGSFFTLRAPSGMPSPSFPGYLDVILFYGQHSLFERKHVEISVYKIFKTLGIETNNGRAYSHFRRDMQRAFDLSFVTDRFRNPITGQRSHVDYFRVLQRMRLAKNRQETSQFWFDDLFLASLRSGYLKRLDWDFCLHLDKRGEALARFLYGHLSKRIGNKFLYRRNSLGFLHDVGLGYIAELEPYRRRDRVKRILYPPLTNLRGKVFQNWEHDPETENIIFIR